MRNNMDTRGTCKMASRSKYIDLTEVEKAVQISQTKFEEERKYKEKRLDRIIFGISVILIIVLIPLYLILLGYFFSPMTEYAIYTVHKEDNVKLWGLVDPVNTGKLLDGKLGMQWEFVEPTEGEIIITISNFSGNSTLTIFAENGSKVVTPYVIVDTNTSFILKMPTKMNSLLLKFIMKFDFSFQVEEPINYYYLEVNLDLLIQLKEKKEITN
ncbi:MAG: hypothetical protein ACFE9L_09240 [Candidatus Hodarchaeota archaeon]